MDNKEAIIIVGAGASGLIAARELLKKGKKIILIEARDRLGGRAHTLYEKNNSIPIEAGAEFIHGELPITFKLVKEYGLSFYKTGGKMINLDEKDEQLQEEEGEGWALMMDKMKKLKEDLPFAVFLSTYFPEDKYKHLRKSAENFANGYDLANPQTASTFSLRDEWENDEGDQFRIKGGYKKLIDALNEDCLNRGCEIYTSEIVKEIIWKKSGATIITNTGQEFMASKVVITIPAGVWHSDETDEAVIKFNPAIPKKIYAFKEIGFGSIIKIMLHFKNAFWEEKYKNAGFFFIKEQVPVWWTQAPEKNNLITGWLGGEPAKKMQSKSEKELLETSLQSLASAFKIEKDYLKEILISSHIFNWDDDSFSRGGYSFSMLNSSTAKEELRKSVDNILFFAGEALYEGTMQGTIEAALWSGLDCVDRMKS